MTETPVGPIREDAGVGIAFRYGSLPAIQNSICNSRHVYDFGAKIPEEKLHNLTSFSDLTSLLPFALKLDAAGVKECSFVLDLDPGDWDSDRLNSVVYRLKSMTRRTPSTVILLLWDPEQHSSRERVQLHNIVDGVMRLEAFNGSSAVFPEFSGLFNLLKIPKINSLSHSKRLETLDLGFLMKKHNRFIEIDKLSLPPDLSETVSRSSCTTVDSKSYDF